MRPLVPLAFALLVTLTARSAAATGLCDPAGHFCVNVDTTSATLCTPLRPGGLTPATCAASDADARQLAKRMTEVSHGALHMLDSFVLRFDDWSAKIMLVRRASEPEVADGGAREAMHELLRWFGNAPHGGVLVDEVTPPTLSRLNGVQVARLESRLSTAGIGGAVITRDVAFEVRSRDAAYIVTFDADEANAARLSALADTTMSTLDALPLEASGPGAGEALVWLLRALVAAGVLVGLAWLLGRRKGGGGRGGMDSRDLWPR